MTTIPESVSDGGGDGRASRIAGKRLDEFRIDGLLGKGSFGAVYRAHDTYLDRPVALKVLAPRLARRGPEFIERFLREARSAAKVSHPAIVTINRISPLRDTYYIVMELVEGGTLQEQVARGGRLDPVEATRVVREAAEALAHAHRRGIVHRDIKPGNILLTGDGRAKVSDFGLARDHLQDEDIFDEGTGHGTPRFLAPEQARGEPVRASGDLYSLAATYFFALTGRPPFDGRTPAEVVAQHQAAPVPDPRTIVPELPMSVARFFEVAMAKRPQDRFQTAEQFIAGLEHLNFEGDDEVLTGHGELQSEPGLMTAVREVRPAPSGRLDAGVTPEADGKAAGLSPPEHEEPPAKGSDQWMLWVLLTLVGVAVAFAATITILMILL